MRNRWQVGFGQIQRHSISSLWAKEMGPVRDHSDLYVGAWRYRWGPKRIWWNIKLFGKVYLFHYLTILLCRALLNGADLHLAYGRRYGLVGRNGLGKTTLLKMMSARGLRIPSHISILHVEQEVVGDDTLALQSVLECDTVRESLVCEERELTAKMNIGL